MRIRSFGREAGLVLLGQLAALAGNLVMVRVLTEYFAPAEYGELALLLTLVTFIQAFIFGVPDSAIKRFYSISRSENKFESFYLSSASFVKVGATLVIIFGFASVLLASQLWDNAPVTSIFIAIVLATTRGLNNAVSALQFADRRRAMVALHLGLDAWLRIPATILIFLCFGSSLKNAVLAMLAASLLVNVWQLSWVRRFRAEDPRRSFEKEKVTHGILKDWRNRMWRYSWPFAAWAPFQWLLQIADRWALEIFATTAEVGLYVVLYQLSFAPARIAITYILNLISPMIFDASPNPKGTEGGSVEAILGKLVGLSLAIAAVGFVLLYFTSDLILRLFANESYMEVSDFMPWMILAASFSATYQLASLKFMANLETKQLLLPNIAGGALGALFLFLGGWFLGLAGVVGAQVVLYVFMLVWLLKK